MTKRNKMYRIKTQLNVLVQVEMVLQDCAGQETYDRLRHVVYAEADVILICFSLDDPDSLLNVERTWIQVSTSVLLGAETG